MNVAQFIRSRVAIASIGFLTIFFVFGGITGGVTAFLNHRAAVAAQQASANTQTSSNGSDTAITTPPPTATAAPQITPTSRPAASSIPNGAISRIGPRPNSFIVNGVIVIVSSSANYSGTAKNFSQLQVGWRVELHGSWQTNGNFLATEVNANPPDGGGDN